MSRLIFAWAIAVVAVFGAAAANAQEGSDSTDGLYVRVAANAWIAWMEGEASSTTGLQGAPLRVDLSDVTDDSQVPANVQVAVGWGRFGLAIDLVGLEEVDLSDNDAGPVFGKVGLETEYLIATFAPYFRAADGDYGIIDLFVGARMWTLEYELAYNPSAAGVSRDRGTETWADPIIGARVHLPFLDLFGLTLEGDVGGFDAASDFTANVTGTVDFTPLPFLAIQVGYRHLTVDYEDGPLVWDMELSGPIVGARLEF